MTVAKMSPANVRITGTGFHVPGEPLDNAEIVRRFGLDVTPEWIVERTGITTRHWLEPGRATSDMAVDAAKAALADAGRSADEMDRLFVATVTPDHPTPATATIVARKLGMRCMAMDLSAACSGFVYGLDLAVNSIMSGRARRVLVVAADARSRFLDPADRRSLVLFGDAAGAAVVERTDAPGFVGFHAGAEGREELGAWIPSGGSASPCSPETVAAGGHYVRMRSSRTLFTAVRELGAESARAAVRDAGVDMDELDWVVPHQGNGVLIDALLDDLEVPAARGIKTIDRFGSCSGAGLPVALAVGRAEGRIRDGHRVLLTSVGAGYTMASAVHCF